MKGFVVKLIPLDDTGIQRNKDFVKGNNGKLMSGGKAEMQPDGSLHCTWVFENKIPVPDSVKMVMLNQFTGSLDKAISKKTNVRYEVEFLDD
jgi:hypothetical protein